MITPSSTNHEWFQITMVLGHFDNRKDAEACLKVMKDIAGTTFISAEIKGSWHS